MIKFLQYLLITLIVGADFSKVTAQPIRNLDFEEVGLVNPQAPLGWTSRNFGQEISFDSDDWMGKYLKDSFGERYRSVGFAKGEGNYTAVLGPNSPVDTFPMPSPRKGSVEYVFRSLAIWLLRRLPV